MGRHIDQGDGNTLRGLMGGPRGNDPGGSDGDDGDGDEEE